MNKLNKLSGTWHNRWYKNKIGGISTNNGSRKNHKKYLIGYHKRGEGTEKMERRHEQKKLIGVEDGILKTMSNSLEVPI